MTVLMRALLFLIPAFASVASAARNSPAKSVLALAPRETVPSAGTDATRTARVHHRKSDPLLWEEEPAFARRKLAHNNKKKNRGHYQHKIKKVQEAEQESASDQYECRAISDGAGEKCCREFNGEAAASLCITFQCPEDTVTEDCTCKVEIDGQKCTSCTVCGTSARHVDYDCANLRAGVTKDVCSSDILASNFNVKDPPEEPQSMTETNKTTTIIIAVCSAVGGLLVLALGILFLKKILVCPVVRVCRLPAKKQVGDETASLDEDGEDARKLPPTPQWQPPPNADDVDIESKAPTIGSQWQLSTIGDDGISTYAGDTIAPRMRVAFQQQHADEPFEHMMRGDKTIATVDFDYCWKTVEEEDEEEDEKEESKSSDVEGALGSDATKASAKDPFGKGGAQEETPPIRGPDRQKRGQTDIASKKEQRFDVFVPPGKLGVIIDTSDDGGPPVVHAMYESSVVAGMVKVGDRLVAVDDKDVSSMSAAKVSKLISLKSGNPSRKLTMARIVG